MLEMPSLVVEHKEGVAYLGFPPSKCVFDASAVKRVRQQFLEAVDNSATARYVISFEGVEYISSTILGLLISGLLKIQKRGGSLRIVGANKDLRELFRLTGTQKLFHFCESVDAAAKSFHGHSKVDSE